jgi:hypothetical protein
VEQDAHYFLMRAEQEEAKAAATQNEAARICHVRLATIYRQTALSQCSTSLGECLLNADPPAIS